MDEKKLKNLTEEQKKKLAKLLKFHDDKELAIFNELQQINISLANLEKFCEMMSGMKMPEIPSYPEMPEMDMTETNNLLKKLLERENQQWEIKLTLE